MSASCSAAPPDPVRLPGYRPSTGPTEADAALRRCLAIRDRAQHGAVLWFADILARRLYRDLGFSSMNQYAQEHLGFSQSRTSDFMALAAKLDQLPTVKRELAAGRLGYTKAREIVSVADRQTERAWLSEAQASPRRELEQKVRAARHRARAARRADPDQVVLPMPEPLPSVPSASPPVRVGFALDPVQHARYEALLERLGPRTDRAGLLLDALEALVTAQDAAGSPRGQSDPPVQIHVHDCPRCGEATVATGAGERTLSVAEREAVREDARIHRPGQPNRATIPPRIRREVLARDRHVCRRRGCGRTRGLHLHHLVPRARGGPNRPENLVTLCGACHRLWHEKGGELAELLNPVPG